MWPGPKRSPVGYRAKWGVALNQFPRPLERFPEIQKYRFLGGQQVSEQRVLQLISYIPHGCDSK